jgi:hypothetical protein
VTQDAQSAPPRRALSRTFIGLAVLLAAGAAAGAWFDWVAWHPSSALALYGAILLLGSVGIVLLLVRRLPTVVRYGAFAIAAGLVAGSVLGPSRPALTQRDGEVVVRLTSPQVAEVRGPASCQTVAAGDQLSVSGNPNNALGEGDDKVFVDVHVTLGDMFRAGDPRSDGLGISVSWSPAREPVEGPLSARMRSTPSSALGADIESLSGKLAFSGLAVDPNEPGATPIDITGTVEWTCEG